MVLMWLRLNLQGNTLLAMVALCDGLLFKLVLHVSSEQIKDKYWYAKTPCKQNLQGVF